MTEYSVVTLNPDGSVRGVVNRLVIGEARAAKAAQDWERSYFGERDIPVTIVSTSYHSDPFKARRPRPKFEE